MSDTENKGPKWHLKSKGPVHGMDIEYGHYCKQYEEFIFEKSIRPSPLPQKNKGNKSKPR